MVTKKPKGLGMGLEALLGPKVKETAPTEDGAVADAGLPSALAVSDMVAGKYQPRTHMDEGALNELAESIKVQGIMQPILVRRVSDEQARLHRKTQSGEGAASAANKTASGDVYEIIAGERRFRAAKLAGLDTVPVLVRNVTDEAAAAMALIENMQREDLNPLEEAHGLQRLIKEFGLTHEAAAQAVGRSRSAASNLLRLLNLAEPVQKMLLAGDVDMGHARALLPLSPAQQILTANEIASRKLSVREAEKLVARTQAPAPAPAQPAQSRPGQAGARDLARLEELLADRLAAQVQIRMGARGQRGELVIRFASLDGLDALLDQLGINER